MDIKYHSGASFRATIIVFVLSIFVLSSLTAYYSYLLRRKDDELIEALGKVFVVRMNMEKAAKKFVEERSSVLSNERMEKLKVSIAETIDEKTIEANKTYKTDSLAKESGELLNRRNTSAFLLFCVPVSIAIAYYSFIYACTGAFPKFVSKKVK